MLLSSAMWSVEGRRKGLLPHPFGLPPQMAPPMIVTRPCLFVLFPCCHKLGADYLYFLQSSPHEKGLSQQELLEALTGQSLKTPEGSQHKSKVQGDGGHCQSSDADSDVAVMTPEQVVSRGSSPGAAAHSVRSRAHQQTLDVLRYAILLGVVQASGLTLHGQQDSTQAIFHITFLLEGLTASQQALKQESIVKYGSSTILLFK